MKMRLIGLLGLLALVLASCGGGTPQASGPSADAPPSEGIVVRGHWTIDITNPDGSHDRTVEFENALLDEGSLFLVNAVAGVGTTGEFVIVLGGPDLECEDESCTLAIDSRVRVDLIGSSLDDTLRLTASTTATTDGEVSFVRTRVTSCPSNVSASECGVTALPSAISTFTQKNLDTPEPVSAGQVIQVQVDLTFQSPAAP